MFILTYPYDIFGIPVQNHIKLCRNWNFDLEISMSLANANVIGLLKGKVT